MLETVSVQCPYCWESFDTAVDISVPDQEYVEDCQVCCRPIRLRIHVGRDGSPHVEALSEDE